MRKCQRIKRGEKKLCFKSTSQREPAKWRWTRKKNSTWKKSNLINVDHSFHLKKRNRRKKKLENCSKRIEKSPSTVCSIENKTNKKTQKRKYSKPIRSEFFASTSFMFLRRMKEKKMRKKCQEIIFTLSCYFNYVILFYSSFRPHH